MNPERLGPYRIVRKLGAGGMGDVFEALHEELNRPVALKLLKPELIQGNDGQRRFRREMQTAASLVHPHLVRLYDGGALDGTLYMAMELVSGEALSDRLVRERPPLAWSIRVARQVADGLACLHAQGILHRDVKPQNILLERDGTAKLADFGLVRTVEGTALTTDGGLLGTLAYMSPELLSGAPATTASDVWALGCVVYMMIAGRGPFVAKGPSELYEQIAKAPLAPVESLVPQLPAAVAQLVARMLDRDPATRLASAADVSAALAALTTAELRPARSRSGGVTVRSSPPPPAPRRAPVAAALAAVVLLGAIAFTLTKTPPPAPASPSPTPRAGPLSPGHPDWGKDVVSRYRALEGRDPRQAAAVVLDAIQELGRADASVAWPAELDAVAPEVTRVIPDQFHELKGRGKMAYAAATMELATDVPDREKAYARELRMRLRDLWAIVPCALRPNTPSYLLVHACLGVDRALHTVFRVFDQKAVLAVENDVLAAIAKADPHWRSPMLLSYLHGRHESSRVANRRRALDLFEKELAVQPRKLNYHDTAQWHEIVLQTMIACDLEKDPEAGRALFAHASTQRLRYPNPERCASAWKSITELHASLGR